MAPIDVAISTNGSPSEVEFLGTIVRFPTSADAPAEIQQQQDELEQFEEEAETRARNEPQAAITAAVDLSGWWAGPDGATFEIGQFGSVLVINTPYGITAADGSQGVGRFVIEDDSTLTGTFENHTCHFEQSATLTR